MMVQGIASEFGRMMFRSTLNPIANSQLKNNFQWVKIDI